MNSRTIGGRQLWVTGAVLAAVALVLGLFGLSASRSSAAAAPVYQVTLAARSCPTYASVTANRARNNIMESLQDLGPDTPYSGDQTVDPTVEAAVQPACTPITGWQFTFGNGIAGQVSGSFVKLSIVSSPDALPPTTQASTPLLNAQGVPTGQNIAGAVTVTLTAAQVQRSEQHNLWIQGGTTTDPINDSAFPGEYGFAALRCASDNVNGDNVEWIGYTQGATHVFCFAYYVRPPPTAGTINIVKQTTVGGTPTSVDYPFNFSGDLSYNPGGAFTLNTVNAQSSQMEFVRAAESSPWSVTEDADPNWVLTSATCTATGGSTSTPIAPSAGSSGGVSITLVASDTITCTFVNNYVPPSPPAGELDIAKVTTGGVGSFPFTVTSTSAAGTGNLTATTTTPGIPVDAVDSGTGTIPTTGPYDITETLPTVAGGTWTLVTAACIDATSSLSGTTLTVTPTSTATPLCLFINNFDPPGSITIQKTTVGALDSVNFLVFPAANDAQEFSQIATTTVQGQPATAQPETPADATTGLAPGLYVIQELTPADDDLGGWALTAAVCNGAPVTPTAGAVTVTLTAATPDVTCSFTNTYTATVAPVAPVSPIAPIVVHPTG